MSIPSLPGSDQFIVKVGISNVAIINIKFIRISNFTIKNILNIDKCLYIKINTHNYVDSIHRDIFIQFSSISMLLKINVI